MRTICSVILIIILSLTDTSVLATDLTDSLKSVLQSTTDGQKYTDICNTLSRSYVTSELDSCRFYAEKAIEKANSVNYKTGMVSGLTNLGNMNFIKGNYPDALQNYMAALNIMEEENDLFGIANGYMGIGNVYYVQKDFELALSYMRKSEAIRWELNDSSGIAGCFNNIGGIFHEMGLPDSALAYHLKAMRIKEDLHEYESLSSSYGNIGNLFRELGRLEEAEDFQNKALEIRTQQNNKKGMVLSYSDIAAIYEQKGEHSMAEKYLSSAIDLASRIQYGEGLKNSLLRLTGVYESIGKIEQAHRVFRRYTEVKDSIVSSEKNRQIAEIQTKYETEKKEQEIELLHRDQQIKEEKLNNQRTVIIIIICCFVLALIAIVAIMRLLRFRKIANIELQKRNDQISLQNEIIEQKNLDITDSIEYAKTIQTAALPGESLIESIFSNYFILYLPRDIVSGDFYWFHQTTSGKKIWVCADCTGHGVPGAFMSILGISLLNEIVINKGHEKPDQILNEMRLGVVNGLKQRDNENGMCDGIDMVLCVLNTDSHELEFAGANNALIYCSENNDLSLYKCDKQPVGFYTGDLRPFTLQSIQTKPGDRVYLFTDGFQDQFGGPKGEKYRLASFRNLIDQTSRLPFNQQLATIEKEYKAWISPENSAQKHEQLDDILIVGVEI